MEIKSPNKVSHANELVDHLFRHESGKMVSVLTRIFGLSHIEIAEDIVQDTFLIALQEWSYRNIPPNPSAWLYKVAKNKTIDLLRHRKNIEKYESEISNLFKSEWTISNSISNLFLDNEIKDSQLRMIFASCHPSLSQESQIAFTLKTLCGFSIKEISKALLTSEANVNKRLFRTRQKLKEGNFKFEIPISSELFSRLDSVYKVIYLLFNEGYNSSNYDKIIRSDLCAEAIRLCQIISEHPIGNISTTFALLSLMCLHAARLDARIDDKGCIILLKEQDRTLWNQNLLHKGFLFLEKSSAGNEMSEYHIQAGIAAHYCSTKSFEETDWKSILNLYELLIKLNPSPIATLNKAIVISQIFGPLEGIKELENLNLQSYYLYHTTLAEFYKQLKQFDKAITHLNKAIKLPCSHAEKLLIKERIKKLKNNN